MLKSLSKVFQDRFKKIFLEDMAIEDDISWYHGSLSRDEAEDVLRNAAHSSGAFKPGLFLIRDSSSSPGDFVLSVINDNDEILNFQIRRHGEDAFFSINEATIFHGLESLVEFYKHSDDVGASNVLPCRLVEHVRKDPPPPHTRRHGRNNLLHRATIQGSLTIVSGLLKDRDRNLEAKNEDGQTAVHIATKLGQETILKMLIDAGANVNCRDIFGNTPLHYACQNNSSDIVRLLLVAGANVQLRNTNTGWVALHEAASRGYKDITEHLLRVGAPARPRTNDRKTPQQLAEDNGHYQLSHIIKTHEGPKPNTSREDWYHGTLSRSEARALLEATNSPNTDGRFLVRYSDKTEEYVLTMLYMDSPYHFVISKEGPFYVIDDGPLLDSLEHVVEHYSTMADGLPTILQTPVKPKPKPPLPLFRPFNSSLFSTLPIKGKKGYRWTEGTATMPLPPKTKPRRSSEAAVQLSADVSPLSRAHLLTSLQHGDHTFIQRENLIEKEVIGEGEFGAVFRAIYQTRNGAEVEVAVKTLHPDHSTSSRDTFLKEAEVMMRLNHHCIVKFIGISQDAPFLMVQELVPLGSMLTYILENPDQVSPDYELHVWASQIACGMEYLENNRLVHRDLAARNILLATRHQAKVSDFGLSRTFTSDRDYYRATKGGRWPIKWYAPESYNYGTFSSASDVWSFGITLWEMFSYGKQPYGDLRGQAVIDLLEKGERLGQPSDCPDDVYQMMRSCWEYIATQRPSFTDLSQFFANHTNYENVKHLISTLDIS